MKGIGIIFALLVIVSCTKEKTLELPKERSVFFLHSNECCVDGEKCECSSYTEFAKRAYEQGVYEVMEPYAFSGYNRGDVNYDELSFYLTPGPFTLSGGKPLYLFFCIVGDGTGPFIEGKDYSNPDNVLVGFPHLLPIHCSGDGDLGYKESESFHGLEVSILSSSIKFGYSYIDEKYVGEVLDFYYEFEEVITKLPEPGDYSGTTYYSVGDTIKVTNGHFVQSLYFQWKDRIHQLIVPQ